METMLGRLDLSGESSVPHVGSSVSVSVNVKARRRCSDSRTPLRNYEEPQMVDEMIDAVRDEPTCLPLLQFVGRQL
jgi:hypothetical protein